MLDVIQISDTENSRSYSSSRSPARESQVAHRRSRSTAALPTIHLDANVIAIRSQNEVSVG